MRMMRFGMIYQPSDIVLIPFPFTDLTVIKKRPVLVITPENNQGDFIGLQVTSKQGYIESLQIDSCDFIVGTLPKISFVRIDKVFTLNSSVVSHRVGRLSSSAFARVKVGLCDLLCERGVNHV